MWPYEVYLYVLICFILFFRLDIAHVAWVHQNLNCGGPDKFVVDVSIKSVKAIKNWVQQRFLLDLTEKCVRTDEFVWLFCREFLTHRKKRHARPYETNLFVLKIFEEVNLFSK